MGIKLDELIEEEIVPYCQQFKENIDEIEELIIDSVKYQSSKMEKYDYDIVLYIKALLESKKKLESIQLEIEDLTYGTRHGEEIMTCLLGEDIYEKVQETMILVNSIVNGDD
ncbi:hypothetical protein P3U41_05925 [Mammaliicoccus sciuri]|uniref:hypothetical protein n=1 Tax=Mammaliicoccus sciuri TaxID=1296 RepID=UPI002B25714F|nr:hypothetical protein [Mammaliicoccus sciuri]WQL34308.1 hypothetical protein P3U41_05925 [Mammaliicoccus sciuri]WQL61247.1 hypothetical protein P3T96_05925 [Mammaliicoccus sciuri]